MHTKYSTSDKSKHPQAIIFKGILGIHSLGLKLSFYYDLHTGDNFNANKFKNFLKITWAISRTTGPIQGLFVLFE